MEVHYRNLRLGIVIWATLLLFLASALTVALQTRRAAQTPVSGNQNSGNTNVGEDYGRRVPTRAKATTSKNPATKPPPTTQTEPKPTTDANDSAGQRTGTGTTPPQTPPSVWTPPQPGPQWKAPKLVPDKYVVQLGEVVTFKLDGLSKYALTHYSFVIDYGDRSPTETLDQNRQDFQHAFRSAQRFKVLAKAIPAHSDVPPDEKRLEPVGITVEQVILFVDKQEVEVGVVVTLTAKSVANDRNVQYRFVFDDGKQTEWQKSNEATHAYSAPRTFEPRVELGFAGGSDIVSDQDSERINVTRPLGTLILTVPDQANADESVSLSAEFPADGKRHLQYRFLFDQRRPDEWTDWQDAKTTSHPFAAGDYEAVAQVGVLIDGEIAELATSSAQKIHVLATQISATPSPTFNRQPTAQPTPDREWPPKILIYILIALLAVLALVIITATGVGTYKWAKSAFAPKPTFFAFSDVGNTTMDQGSLTTLVEFEVHLDPNLGRGFYDTMTHEPTLIGAERSHP